MKYSLKGHKVRNRHKNRIKRSGQAQSVYARYKNHNAHHMTVSPQRLLVTSYIIKKTQQLVRCCATK